VKERARGGDGGIWRRWWICHVSDGSVDRPGVVVIGVLGKFDSNCAMHEGGAVAVVGASVGASLFGSVTYKVDGVGNSSHVCRSRCCH
jgi:hypothetical protein